MRIITAKIIKMVMGCDETTTKEERDSVLRAIGLKKRCNIDNSKDVSIAEASAETGLCRTTIWKMCANGSISSVRRGKKYFIPSVEVIRMKGKQS